MTNEIMPREDRMGKILTFIGGCLTGVLGVFAVAVMSEMTPSAESSDDSGHDGVQNGPIVMSESNNNSIK